MINCIYNLLKLHTAINRGAESGTDRRTERQTDGRTASNDKRLFSTISLQSHQRRLTLYVTYRPRPTTPAAAAAAAAELTVLAAIKRRRKDANVRITNLAQDANTAKNIETHFVQQNLFIYVIFSHAIVLVLNWHISPSCSIGLPPSLVIFILQINYTECECDD